MARDRLAAMRAQQQQRTEGNDSYPSQSNGPAYEMSPVTPNSNGNVGGGDSMASFYAEVSFLQDGIRTVNDNVARIGDLHSRTLNSTDDAANQRNAAQLDELVEETRKLISNLKTRIKALESQGASGRDGQIRKQQTALVKSKFVEAIQNYQTVEQQYRTKYKQRMERQFKIVKPDATAEEVRAVVNDESSGGQIFQQAMMNSDRYGDSRAAYREVQERHQEIRQIEQTLAELAQLFNDMSVLIAEQDEAIKTIETQATKVAEDTEAGLRHTEKGVEHARAARKKRWICFFLTLIILIIVGIVVGVVVSKAVNK
ncbi:hypothetical protein E1B28_009271 [Marasmius oreades]|uniref:t-SNARE coiled-coil homology domain-containing protein n=1 Tax=Marasmius oreades TaxID=181124 RepID=A0A9P7S0B7_9AGAR|nr:uncharacterized protein E1B28_009271 [Marasmius oreades]KAG7092970.1 hypothetical protein E1B28_009271 [Marasmius oreades]